MRIYRGGVSIFLSVRSGAEDLQMHRWLLNRHDGARLGQLKNVIFVACRYCVECIYSGEMWCSECWLTPYSLNGPPDCLVEGETFKGFSILCIYAQEIILFSTGLGINVERIKSFSAPPLHLYIHAKYLLQPLKRHHQSMTSSSPKFCASVE